MLRAVHCWPFCNRGVFVDQAGKTLILVKVLEHLWCNEPTATGGNARVIVQSDFHLHSLIFQP